MFKQTTTLFNEIAKKPSKLQIQVDNLFHDAIRRGDVLSDSLTRESYLKHRIIERYRTLYLNKQHLARQEQLEKQYGSMKEAMDFMKEKYPSLYELSKENDKNKRFPVEYRVPQDYPPAKVWEYEYLKNKKVLEEAE